MRLSVHLSNSMRRIGNMKRFEYQYIFVDKIDPYHERIMGTKQTFDEFPLTVWLDGYKEMSTSCPIYMFKYFKLIRFKRTGKKIRSIDLIIKIRLYKFFKSLR